MILENESIEEQEQETDIVCNNWQEKKWLIKSVGYFILYSAIFFFASYIMPCYVCGKVTVDGNSMQNTLQDGDHLINEKLSYHFEKPKRFDIVIVTPFTTAAKADQEDDYWVKRIIGLPGETIQIKGGKVYIDGELLEEDIYGNGDITYQGVTKQGYTIPEGEYFLMGDNRIGKRSYDSRYKEVGTFSKDQIVGRIIFRTSPLFGTVE